MDESPTITCSAIEATFLASLLGGDMLLGMPDPFPGWLTEEIHASWAQAQKTLAERRYIEIESDGRIVIDTAVAALVSTWASPEASFILTFTSPDTSNQTRYFHLTRYLAVEQHLTSESLYQLTALEDARAIFQRIMQIWRLKDQTAAPGAKTLLSAETLTRVRTVAQENVVEAETLLKQAGVDEATACALGRTLAQPNANGALVALARRTEGWDVFGLGILESVNGLWRLRSFNRDLENWIEVIPADAAQVCVEIRRLMNRVLPEPLLM